MRRRMAVVGAAVLAAMPATAQTTAVTDGEVSQCIVAMSKLADVASAADKPNVNAAMLYFLGKLAVRHSPAEIRTLIAGAAADDKLNVAAVGGECASEVQALGTTLQGK